MRTLRIAGLAAAAAALATAACREPVPVEVYRKVAVEPRDIVVTAQAAGVIEPDTTVEVKSKASGEVLDVLVETGERVERGALLVRIDQRIPRNSLLQSESNLEVAKAKLANAEAQLRRSDELFKSQSITETEHEAAVLAYANAKADLVRAEVAVETDRIALSDTDVLAPISGVVIGKSVERGQVISSPTRDVSGGTVLLTMADLTLVQVRTLVDETDIGKIRPGLPATVTVASYPNQPFEGAVLKIEPQAVTQQNVTMFPVLIRIQNRDQLLKPGMNSEVQISIGRRDSVLALPNTALRTERDVASAASVLGLDQATLKAQLASNSAPAATDSPPRGDTGAAEPVAPAGETMTLQNGRSITLPAGVTAEQVRAIMAKRRSGEALTAEEEALATTVFAQFRGRGGGGRGGPGGPAPQQTSAQESAAFGGDYLVFVLRNGQPTVVRVRTGLTDLDYSEVLSGVSAGDSVLVLPNVGTASS